MGGVYGRTLAGKHIQDGRYDEAVTEATRALERDDHDTVALVDRAHAQSALGRHAEAAVDLENAARLDESVGELEIDAVDDAYFSALLAVARAAAEKSPVAAAAGLSRYPEVFPRGQHLGDVVEWQKRLRGEIAPTLIVKERA